MHDIDYIVRINNLFGKSAVLYHILFMIRKCERKLCEIPYMKYKNCKICRCKFLGGNKIYPYLQMDI